MRTRLAGLDPGRRCLPGALSCPPRPAGGCFSAALVTITLDPISFGPDDKLEKVLSVSNEGAGYGVSPSLGIKLRAFQGSGGREVPHGLFL